MKLRPKSSGLLLNLLLTLICAVVALVGVEVAYRVYRQVHVAYKASISAPSYSVFNEPLWEYNREFGYSYIPTEAAIEVLVKDGYPVQYHEYWANEMGNRNRIKGAIKGAYEEADLKLLVFGDSFTAQQHNRLTWPDLLQDKLGERLGKKVNVINFGRGGYPVLQMFDLASAKLKEFNPDLIIIAFITAESNTARRWITPYYINGEKQFCSTTEPSQKAYLTRKASTTIFNSSVTKEWCDSMLASPNPDDPLLAELNDQSRRLNLAKAARINFTSFSTSLLFNMIVHGNPLPGCIEIADYQLWTPSSRLAISDFASDPRFAQNVVILNQSNVPYYLIQLPTHEELAQKKYTPNEQQKLLLQSLEKLTDKKIISLLEHGSAIDNFEHLFLHPETLFSHPSYQGLEFFAEAISEMLITKGCVP